MKKTAALVLLLVGFVFQGQAQNKEQKNIEKVIQEVITLTENGEYVKVLDHTYPGLFKLASKEMMAEQMDEVFNSAELKISMNNFTTGEVGEIKKGETAEYAIVPYNYNMSMQYMSEEANADLLNMTAGVLKDQFGADKVSVDEKSKTINIENESEMLAIRDNGTENWTILEIKADQLQMLEMVLPADVYEAVK